MTSLAFGEREQYMHVAQPIPDEPVVVTEHNSIRSRMSGQDRRCYDANVGLGLTGTVLGMSNIVMGEILAIDTVADLDSMGVSAWTKLSVATILLVPNTIGFDASCRAIRTYFHRAKEIEQKYLKETI